MHMRKLDCPSTTRCMVFTHNN